MSRPRHWPYNEGDLVRWIWDNPAGTPPGVVLNVLHINNRPMVEVWWVDSGKVTTLHEEDLVLVSPSNLAN
jgi:hypothetical protein